MEKDGNNICLKSKEKGTSPNAMSQISNALSNADISPKSAFSRRAIEAIAKKSPVLKNWLSSNA